MFLCLSPGGFGAGGELVYPCDDVATSSSREVDGASSFVDREAAPAKKMAEIPETDAGKDMPELVAFHR